MSDHNAITIATCAYVRELKQSLFGTSRYWHIFPAIHQSRLRISSSGVVEFPHMDLDGVENPMCLYGMNFAVSDDSRPLVICKDEASALTGHILDPGTDYLATGSLLWNVEIPGWVKKRRIFIAPDSGDYESCMEQWSMLLKDIAWLCIDTVFPDYEDAICRQGLNPLGNYYLHRFRKLQTTEPYEALRTFATLSNGLLNVDVWDFMRNFQLYIKS